MDPITIALISIVALFVAILLGVHVAFALAMTSFIGLFLLTGSVNTAFRLLGSTSFEALRAYIFAVVPLFILMGAFMNNSRAAETLYSAAYLLLRKVLGGLAIATVIANAMFAAVTGISVASAAVFSRVALPEMVRHGYQRRFALGSIAGSSVLGMLIPPSVLLIIYGILTQVSIGRLFLAGIVPGLLLATIYSIGIVVMVWRNPRLAGANGASIESADGERETAESQQAPVSDNPEQTRHLGVLLGAVPILLLVIVVLGGIWGGLFTPTEASAIGALGALIIGAFLGMGRRGLGSSFLETAQTTGAIMLLLIAASMYSVMLASTNFVTWLETLIAPLLVSPIIVILVFVLVLLLLGTVLDSSSILLLMVPLMFPIISSAGMDPIWFGIVMIVTIEMGLITPPFGMIPFAMSAVVGDQAKAEDIFVGAFPFLIMMLVFLVLLIAFPGLSTWLPNLLL
jgi:tripartite ATP-independent transporter DctM subunit